MRSIGEKLVMVIGFSIVASPLIIPMTIGAVLMWVQSWPPASEDLLDTFWRRCRLDHRCWHLILIDKEEVQATRPAYGLEANLKQVFFCPKYIKNYQNLEFFPILCPAGHQLGKKRFNQILIGPISQPVKRKNFKRQLWIIF